MSSLTYTNAQRSFLQYITAKRILTAPEVNAAYIKSCNKYEVDTSAGLQQFVMSINMLLSPLHLSIKKSIQEDIRSDKSCFVLINTLSTAATKILTSLTPWEENLLEKITEMIVENDYGNISEIDAVNLGQYLKTKKASPMECEESINKMISNRLLNKDDDCLMLSGLTLVEQQQLLESNYPESCVKCFTCKVITIRGYCCENCDMKIHRSCGIKLWRQAKRTPYCPNCKTDMTHCAVPNRDSISSQ